MNVFRQLGIEINIVFTPTEFFCNCNCRRCKKGKGLILKVHCQRNTEKMWCFEKTHFCNLFSNFCPHSFMTVEHCNGLHSKKVSVFGRCVLSMGMLSSLESAGGWIRMTQPSTTDFRKVTSGSGWCSWTRALSAFSCCGAPPLLTTLFSNMGHHSMMTMNTLQENQMTLNLMLV